MDIKKYKKEQAKASKYEKISNALAKSIHLHGAVSDMKKKLAKKMSFEDRVKKHKAEMSKMKGIDMMPHFRKEASEGRNPFKSVTHINGKKIK